MTGYGKVVIELPSKTMRIEMRSLNSKSLDVNMRIPSDYRSKELELRKIVGKRMGRGKIDVSIYIETNKTQSTSKVNKAVVQDYIQQLKSISDKQTETELLKMAIRLPDAISSEKEEVNGEEWTQILEGLEDTLNHIETYRKDEGLVLFKVFQKHINAIDKNLQLVVEIDSDRIESVRGKLEKGITELKEDLDKNRFEQELIYYIEKLDITEEKVRLKNHLSYFLESLNSTESNGKKLGFISQEIGREINTIGSKANFAPMQKLVVQMKDDLEKIKEQLLNIL